MKPYKIKFLFMKNKLEHLVIDLKFVAFTG